MRPLVIVYQEIAQPQATPSAPDLNSVIVAPCYVIKDYPDDANETLLTQTYGERDQPAGGSGQYTPPASGTDALTLTSYPANAPGALVDKASVRLTLRFPRVSMGATYSGCGTVYGSSASTYNTVGNENLVEVTGADFPASGVKSGDRVILTDGSDNTIIRVVRTVGEPDSTGTPSNVARLRLTENVPASGWVVGTAEMRIERVLDTQTLVDPTNAYVTFPEANTDKMVLKGGLTLNVTVGTATVAKPLSFAEVYVSYRALRQDLSSVLSLTDADRRSSGGIASLVGLGKIDARNPGAVAVSVALQCSGGAPVYFYGVQSDDVNGHAIAREAMSSRRDLYCFAVMSQDINVIGGYKAEWDNLASPTYAIDNGVPQLFRTVIGNLSLPKASTVAQSSIVGEAQQQTSSGTGLYRTVSFAGSPTVSLDQVLPGDTVTFGLTLGTGQWASRRGSHRVSHVNSATQIELEPGTSRWNNSTGDSAGGMEAMIVSPNGTVKFKRVGFVEMLESGNGIHVETLVPTTTGGPYRLRLVDTGNVVPVVSIVGFDITVNFDAGVTTRQAIVDAINNSVVTNTVVTASVVGSAGAVANAVGFTSLLPYFVYRDSIDTGSDGIRVRLRNSPASPTIEYNNTGSVSVVVVGNAITVNYNAGTTTLSQLVTAINANTDAAALVEASLTAASITTTSALDGLGLQQINQIDQTFFNGTVTVNDDLYLRLSDSTGQFVTLGVRIGDVVEIPVNPNDYAPSAFDGRMISYRVAQLISESQLLIENLGDDSAAVAKELPHGYARDIPGLLIDNNPAGSPTAAQNYRIRRTLTKDEQVLAMIATAASFNSSRTVLTFPDEVTVTDLKDGSLPRTSALILTPAGRQKGYYLGAQIAGAVAGLPPQHGLTLLGLPGLDAVHNSSGFFRENQLARLSDGGIWVVLQPTPNTLPYCMHQLTTNPTTLQGGEFSMVKNIDFVSVFLQRNLEGFLGQYNVLPETIDDILQSINAVTADLTSRKVAKIGPPLLSGEVTKIQEVPGFSSRIEAYFKGKIPSPLNNIDLRVLF